MGLIIHGLLVVLFLVLALVFSRGKGAWLIAGYNTMPAKEKEKYDQKKLCQCMAKLMLVLACCWLVVLLGDAFNKPALYWIGLGLCGIAIVAAIVYMNTGKPFAR